MSSGVSTGRVALLRQRAAAEQAEALDERVLLAQAELALLRDHRGFLHVASR